jgi:hypothetical protein
VKFLAATATFALMALTTTADAQSTLTPRNSAALPVSAHSEILGWHCGDLAIIRAGNGVEILIDARAPARISISAERGKDDLFMNGRRCVALRSIIRRPDAVLPAQGGPDPE